VVRVQIVYQANTLLEQVGHHVQSVILDTFRALAGVIVILVQKAPKRQAEVCVRLVMQEKQIRPKVRNLAGNVRREHIPQALVRIIAHRVAQEHIKTKQVKQLVKNVIQDPINQTSIK
jgi:hypothetical protein